MTEVAATVAPPRPTAASQMKFYGLWVLTAVALLVLPKIFSSGGSLTTFSLIGISIIFALSYNILLGQTGMLSFGHAVYYGLGGFLAIHAINIIGANKWPIPLPLVPLIAYGAIPEVCPSSNIVLGIFKDYASHPLRVFFDRGLKVTLGSDDPSFFGTTIGREYQIARDHFGFTEQELLHVTRNALEAAFLDAETRARLFQRNPDL